MNRVFYVLLFLTISGFGVIWWLYNALPPEETAVKKDEARGLVVHEDAPALDPMVETVGSEGLQTEGDPHDAQTAAGMAQGQNTASVESPKALSTAVKNEGKSSIYAESIPPGAMVYVDGVLKGKTPFTFEILAPDKIVRFELEGHERQEKIIEAHHREAGTLTRWKIDLKVQTALAKTVDFQKADYRLTGKRGSHFIQLKAVESNKETGWLVAVQSFRDKIKSNDVYACEVDLGKKGKWTRFLVGPFNARAEAQATLAQVRKLSGESGAFLVGDQPCLE